MSGLIVVLVLTAVVLWPARGARRAAGVSRRAAVGRPAGASRVSPTEEPGGIRGIPPGFVPGGVENGPRLWSGLFTPLVSPLRRRRTRLAEEAGLVMFVDALAAAVEAGLPPESAIEVAAGACAGAAVRQLVVDVVTGGGRYAAGSTADAEDGVGGGIGGAAGESSGLRPPGWPAASHATAVVGVDLLARAWSLCEELGAPVADTLRTVASVLRAEHRRRRAVASAVAEARATVRVLTLLPLLGPGLAALLGVGAGEVFAAPAALGSAAVGCAFLFAGRAWMNALVGRVARVGDHA